MNYEISTKESVPGYAYNPIRGFYPKAQAPDLKEGVEFDKIPPILRTLLVSDGTVTKFLEAFYWEPVQVKRLFHEDRPAEKDIVPLDIKAGDSVLHRRVLLQGMISKNVYGYAASFIRTDLLWASVRDDLVQGRLGIGELLRDRRVETYRELLTYESSPAGELARDLACQENAMVIMRSYRILIGGKPCLFISEHFPVHHFETEI
jgi:chorismate-pyruvate lyase